MKGHTHMHDLQEKRERLLAEARERLDLVTKNTDESRAAELEAQHDAAMAEFDRNEALIERHQKLAAVEARVRDSEEREREQRRPGRDSVVARGAESGEPISYREAFRQFVQANGVTGDMEPEARTVLRAGYAKLESRAQTTTNSAGGFTVPVELANILVKSMKAWGPMYDEDVCTVISTAGGGQITMPTVDDTAVTAEKAPAQGTTYTDDGGKDAVFGQKVLDAFPFQTEWLRVSKELADDSIFAFEQLLGDLLGERLGRVANLELTVGDGTGDPNGVVTASTLGKTATGTTVFTIDELLDLEHSVDPAYRMSPKAAWMFNDTSLLALRKVKDGEGNYIFSAGSITNGTPGTLLGRRFWINQAMANAATAQKPIIFGDFGKYFVRKVGAPMVGAVQDKDFWPGFGMAGYIRFDGELGDAAAIKHLIMA
jgi:HK97 family phage major capsid protein